MSNFIKCTSSSVEIAHHGYRYDTQGRVIGFVTKIIERDQNGKITRDEILEPIVTFSYLEKKTQSGNSIENLFIAIGVIGFIWVIIAIGARL